MSKAIVIVGMAGVGKTVLAQKYDNIIDFDHLFYKYSYSKEALENRIFEQLKGFQEGRTINPDWPENYTSRLFEYIEQYDIVLLPSDKEIIDYLDKLNFEYFLCYPNVKSKDIYINRYRNRKTNPDWIDKMNRNFEEDVAYFESKNVKKIVLFGNETLEDKLKEMKIL